MSAQLKAAKDALISSLYELSKAATASSDAAVDFYNASGVTNDEDATLVFSKLADSLRVLTAASQNISNTTNQIVSHDNFTSLSTHGFPQQGQIAQAGETKPPKKKVERDPNAPKKPLTVFFAYSAYLRQSLKEDRESRGLPPLSSTEITQEISKKWNELSEVEKDKWKEAYNEELDTYHTVKEKYLEAKKNGEDVTVKGPNPAPVPIPAYIREKSKKRSSDDSSDKKEKKKKSKKKKSLIPDAIQPDLSL